MWCHMAIETELCQEMERTHFLINMRPKALIYEALKVVVIVYAVYSYAKKICMLFTVYATSF
jgi:hypothetical protein